MSKNLNDEHSYLCLVTIYVIHVVLFHVYSPEATSMTNVTIHPSKIQPANMARWKNNGVTIDRPENFSSLFTGDGEQPNADTINNDRDNDDYLNERNTINRIIGGVEATLGQFPHQVSIRRSRSGVHFCGGNIIDEEWIVTAAHCMYSDNKLVAPSSITVHAGDLLLNQISSNSQSRRVRSIFVHEDFNLRTLVNDIALLKLRSKLTLNNVTVASKVVRNDSVEDGTMCQVSGWGVTQHGTTVLSNELLYVNVPIINRTLCQQLMVNYSNIPKVMICAGYIEGGFDSCQGDSGGGLICDDVLTGLVSWGKECGLAKFPGIYTNVNVFKDWILDTIASNASSPTIGTKDISPAFWGVFLGCVVFFITSRDQDKYEL